jgi:hypothetical protein
MISPNNRENSVFCPIFGKLQETVNRKYVFSKTL